MKISGLRFVETLLEVRPSNTPSASLLIFDSNN